MKLATCIATTAKDNSSLLRAVCDTGSPVFTRDLAPGLRRSKLFHDGKSGRDRANRAVTNWLGSRDRENSWGGELCVVRK